MIELPPISQAILEELGREMGGCDFTGDSEKSFLECATARDFPAAPGNGKTTLLVAKLCLLSRYWTSTTSGVCVVSHTNAARDEVEDKLAELPSAARFLGYPHFVGTVTAFVDRFIALPYLRGLGWSIQQIDNEVFESVALSRWQTKEALRRYAFNREYALKGFVRLLELDKDFECDRAAPPTRLAIVRRPKQPGPDSETGAALEELKADLIGDGFYRFEDMNALAMQALDKTPGLVERLRARFPLVMLDEAQDTNGVQLTLLDRIFNHDDVAYQRLGDPNQTLYENEEIDADAYWTPREGAVSLDQSRRFGPEIASFASRLTVRRAQDIQGRVDRPNRRSLILFDRDSIGEVLPKFADEVSAHWDDPSGLKVHAVASRHNPAGAAGNWPKTLLEYWPDYQSSHSRRDKPETLCAVMRQASLLHQGEASPAEIVDLTSTALALLLRRQGMTDVEGRVVSKSAVWRYLRAVDPSLPLRIRRLVRDLVLHDNAPWAEAQWEAFCAGLVELLGITEPVPDTRDFLGWVECPATEIPPRVDQASRTVFEQNGVSVRLGSVHSVKGRTVDAILVVETEVWRTARCMDLGTVLPHAFGIEDRDLTTPPVNLSAATNIFVGITRPRELLALAMRKDAASSGLIQAAESAGWNIVDLTVQPRAGAAE